MFHVCVENREEEIQLRQGEILCCSGLERRWSWVWRCGWPPSTCGQEKTSCNPPTPRMQHHSKVVHCIRTSQTCIRSLIGSSRRGTWNAVWRRSPCGCSQSLRGRWRSNPAEEGWPGDNHPAGKTEENHSPEHIHLQNASAEVRAEAVCKLWLWHRRLTFYTELWLSQTRRRVNVARRAAACTLDKRGCQVSPGGTCRRTGWSWWRPPRASASHCCS